MNETPPHIGYGFRTHSASYRLELQFGKELSLLLAIYGHFCAHWPTFLFQPCLWLPGTCRCDLTVQNFNFFLQVSLAFGFRASLMEFTSWDDRENLHSRVSHVSSWKCKGVNPWPVKTGAGERILPSSLPWLDHWEAHSTQPHNIYREIGPHVPGAVT